MKIRNVVFDLGGVLFEWDVDRIISNVFEDTDLKERIRDLVFRHPDWLELDRGSFSKREAISRFAARTGCPIKDIRDLMTSVKESLVPIPACIDLANELRARGVNLFVLSNMHRASFWRIHKRFCIWDIFRGIVISAFIRRIKPDADIFEYLLSKYGLKADETVFIDDHEMNVRGAENVGIKGILFTSISQCRSELEALLSD